MDGVRIELLGGFRLSVGGRAVPDATWRRRRPAALVKILALAPAHRLHREQIMDVLWPELDPVAASANLRKALHLARRAVDDSGGEGVLCSDADGVWLARDRVWLDVDAFRAAIASSRRTRDVDEYRHAVDLYREGLLPEDRYEEWAIAPREELQQDFIAALEELAGLLEARADLGEAIEVVRRMVAVEPLREESHAALIRLYALAGRRGDALRAYESLTKLLETELGTDPGAETQHLYEEVRARQSLEPELSVELWERVGDLRVMSGDAAGAAKAFAQALDAGSDAEAAARLERKCADAWLVQHRPELAAPHLAAAESLASEPAELARLRRAQSHHAWETGDIAAAERYAVLARDLAQQHGTPDDVAAAHEAMAIVSHFKGEWRAGVESELDRQAMELPNGSTDQLARVYDLHHCIGQYHLYGDGLWPSVEEYARHTLDRAEDAGAVRAQAFAWCLLGESLLLQARWDESAGSLARSCELHASLGSRSGALAWQRRAELAVCRGTGDEVAGFLEEAATIATVSAMALHLWGRIQATKALAAVERGDADDAVRAVRAAAAYAARYGDCPSCSALLNPVAAEAFALLGDAESGRPYAQAAGRVAEMFNSAAWRAMAESAAGSVASAERNHAAAVRHFDAARDLYEAAGQPYWSQRAARLISSTATT